MIIYITQKQYSSNESRKARYLRAVQCFQWPILTSIQFNAPILRTAKCPFVTDQSLKKKHPPQKLQLQWGKKQTNKNWVVLTSCLLSLRFTVRRRAEEWAEINVLLLIVKDHLLRPTGNWLEWFTPVSNSLRSSRWTQCFPDSRCGTHQAAAVFWLAQHGWKVCPLRPSLLPDRLLPRHFLLLLYVIENMTSHQRYDENHIVNHANRNTAENDMTIFNDF